MSQRHSGLHKIGFGRALVLALASAICACGSDATRIVMPEPPILDPVAGEWEVTVVRHSTTCGIRDTYLDFENILVMPNEEGGYTAYSRLADFEDCWPILELQSQGDLFVWEGFAGIGERRLACSDYQTLCMSFIETLFTVESVSEVKFVLRHTMTYIQKGPCPGCTLPCEDTTLVIAERCESCFPACT